MGNCTSGDHATSCSVGIRVVYYCKDSAADGQEECDDHYGTVIGQEVCFGGATGAPTYPNWDPDASIALVSGVYEVDSDLLDEVREDFNVVTQEDSSKLLLLTGGYAEIVSINSNDMAHHLGLQNDDVILSVSDGVTGTIYLNSWADYAYAIATYNSATSLSVIVDRGGTNVTLDYSII